MAAPKALNHNQHRSVVSRYKKGASSRELADQFGVHRSTIIATVRDMDPSAVRRPGGSKPRKAK